MVAGAPCIVVRMQEGFAQLRAEVVAENLFRRTYLYYGVYAVVLLAATASSLWLITATQSPLIQFFNALFLGACFVQAGMLGHDLSHNQVFESRRLNKYFSTVAWGLLAAASESRWYMWHNTHHAHVNHINHDPDLDIPFLFSEKQLEGRSAFVKKYILPNQHILFFLFLPMVYLGIHRDSVVYIFMHPSWKNAVELILITVHFAALLYLLFAFLPWAVAGMFFIVHALSGGLYMGITFAPNHKGEKITDEHEAITWLHQITSTRNLRPNRFIFHFFGGLNFQIEHHLFPGMPRMHYPKANKIVKAFCSRNNIEFNETTFFGSMKEIYEALKRESTLA